MLDRLIPAPRHIKRTGDDSPAHTVLGYVRRMSGWHQLAICTLALAVAGLAMAPLELQRRLVNDAIGQGDAALLAWLCAIYLGVVLVNALLKYALRFYQHWLSESAVRYSRAHLLRIHECRVASTDSRESEGRAVSILGNEVDQLGGFVGEGLSQVVVNAGMLLAIGGYMALVEPVVAAVCFALLLPQAVVAPYLQRRLNQLIGRRLELMRAFSDDIAGLPPDGEVDDAAFDRDLCAIYSNRMRIAVVKQVLKGSINLVNNLAPIAIFFFGGWMVVQGATSVGVVVAFVSGVQRLEDPIRELMAYVRTAARAGVQHQLIARWM